MKLESGLYKIKSGSGVFTQIHILKIWKDKSQLFYQLDHGFARAITDSDPRTIVARERLEGLSILKHYTSGKFPVKKARVIVKVTDPDGDQFEFAAVNVHALRNIFLEFPQVAHYLGIKLKKK